jgi:4-hydroxy-tetrahydrodipicolinate synthase
MLFPFEFPDGFRAAAALRGFDFGAGRLPQTGAQKTDRAEMAKVLQCILADFELVARPPEGCAPRTGQPAPEKLEDKLEQVVFEVMHELQKRGIF